MRQRLTELAVQHAQQRWLCDGGGLYLQEGRAWIFRYKRNGRTRMMGLGPLELVSLAEARELALAARKQLLAGIDPLAARCDQQHREFERQHRREHAQRQRRRQRLALAALRSFGVEPEHRDKGRVALTVLEDMGIGIDDLEAEGDGHHGPEHQPD
jgi:hypothetical protein